MRKKPRDIEKVHPGNGVDLEESSFRIGDLSAILGILRDRMYSNPIHIICQEITSNARDAHREVNKHFVPIKVSLPTAEDPFLRIRDFGPGIDPGRMKNIFLGYGLTTKGDDDMETGGFGLGGKTPLAYSDEFDIISITPEYETMVKRHWHAYIDESKIGKMSLKEYVQTDEEQGTEIVIPIKQSDWAAFTVSMRLVCNWWHYTGSVLPDVTPLISWQDFDAATAYEGLNWRLMRKDEEVATNNAPLAIVDGIPYPLDMAVVARAVDDAGERTRINGITQVPLRLFFDTGEVTHAANREALDYSKDTIDMILFRCRNFLTDMDEVIKEEVMDADNLWDANLAYGLCYAKLNDLINALSIEPTWKGITLHRSHMDIHYAHMGIYGTFCSVEYRPDNPALGKPMFITDKKRVKMIFSEGHVVIVDDTPGVRPNRARLLTVFRATGRQMAYVFKLPKEDYRRQVAMLTLENTHHIASMNPIYLSQVAPTKLPRKKTPRDATGQKVISDDVKQVILVEEQGTSRHAKLIPSTLNLEEGSGYYIFNHYNRQYYDQGKENGINVWFLGEMMHRWNLLDLVAIRPSQADRLGDGWVPLKARMHYELDQHDSNPTAMYWERESMARHAGKFGLSYALHTRHQMTELLEAELPTEHLLRQWINLVRSIDDRHRFASFIMDLRKALRREKEYDGILTDYAKLAKRVRQAYPLLTVLRWSDDDLRSRTRQSDMYERLMAYVRFIDGTVSDPSLEASIDDDEWDEAVLIDEYNDEDIDIE